MRVLVIRMVPEEDFKNSLKEEGIKLLNVKNEYETWYSEALVIVKQIIPDRLSDFVKQYKDEKRKVLDFLSYGVSDYLIGARSTRGIDVVVDDSAALPKFQNQILILKSASKKFESSLFDIKEILQADLFDSELDAAFNTVYKQYHQTEHFDTTLLCC